MEINAIVTFLAGFLAGGGVGGLLFVVLSLRRRVQQLEQAGPPKLPYKSRDEIENATAALNYLLLQSRLDQDAIENARSHLLRARDPDKEL